MYLCRVPVRQSPPQRPHCLVEDIPDTHVDPESLRVAHPSVHRLFCSRTRGIFDFLNKQSLYILMSPKLLTRKGFYHERGS